MAYYNGYPATYQPVYQPFAQQPTMPQPQSQNGIIWVSGVAGAKAYLVAPNNTVQLWDSEAQTIYLKSADASGMPSMKVLDYTIRDLNKNGPNSPFGEQDKDLSVFATKAEIKAVSDQIAALQDRVDGLTNKKGE